MTIRNCTANPWGQRHKFSPRYDCEPPKVTEFDGSLHALAVLVETGTKKTYVRDVCEYCGETVEREKP